MDQKEIEQVVKAVLAGIASAPAATASAPKTTDTHVYGAGVFASLADAVSAAKTAGAGLNPVSMRKIAVDA
ncbi:MAG: aldehyde dehydrogenase EutE, partial [Enterobacterales bacterium]|nr:aldehyde dehydrogenase EutE [Enterobacterales bacterium]